MFDPNGELPVLAPEATHERYGQLKGYAQLWAYEHGWMVYEGISDDIQEWAIESHSRTLTEDDCDTILALLEDAELTFKGEIAGGPDIPENDRTQPHYWIGYHYGMLMHFADGLGKRFEEVADELVSRAKTYPDWTDAELFALFRNENELP